MRSTSRPFIALGFALTGLAAALASSCGSQDPDTVVEYYVEDEPDAGATDSEGDARGQRGDDDGDGDGGESGELGLRFVSPSAPTDGGATLNVVVAFDAVAAEDTWSLYYATSAEAAEGTAIATELPVTTTSVDWDTSKLAPGDYYLFATLAHAGEVTRHAAPAAVTVAPTVPGANTKPQIKITVPNGEEVFVAGAPQAVTFTGQDADGDALTYAIEYSADGGTTWTSLVKDLTAPTYSWNVTGLAQGTNYRIRVTGDDGKGGSANAVSAKSFGVATLAPTFAAAFGTMMQQRCGNCHAAGRPNAAQFRSDNYALGIIGVSAKQNNIKNRIDAGTMPPAGPLGAADKTLLTLWLWSGAK